MRLIRSSSSLILLSFLIIIVTIIDVLQCLPVVTQKPTPKTQDTKHDGDSKIENLEDAIEYEKYLKEVVNVLETDPDFRAKLNKAAESDIRSGKIAQELEFVSHHVRSKLDELKRQELERLRLLATRQFELSNSIDRNHMKIPEHLDHENEHTFEIEDLKRLILKTTEDLAEADRRRRDEFKQYEMQKEFERQEKIRSMDEEHKKQYEQELKAQQQKHDDHEKIHHPGNKAQLEEVWEKQDHMDGEFDPKTFFMLHDLDGNGFWDENEVKALFIKELDKIYQAGHPEDDMRERAEEMERMREHVFKEADTNHDGLISYQEFLDQTKRDEFQRDPQWDTVDHQQQFSHDEYLEFERRRQEEIQRLIAEGRLPPHPNMPHAYDPQQHGGAYQVHPNAIPQQYHPQPPPGQPIPHYQQQQGHPNQVPQYQQYPQQVNHHPNQVYEHVANQQQHPPQYQAHPNQVPVNQQQVHPNQPPPSQYQQHPNQQQTIQQQPIQQQPNQQHPNQQHPNQIQNQQHQNQMPVNQQPQQNQPQYQPHPAQGQAQPNPPQQPPLAPNQQQPMQPEKQQQIPNKVVSNSGPNHV
uniref:Putative nucleobindin 2 n=1 Tax=Corethrella appendiculata TaxID=1370023 RepID=U5EJI6_9DIPT